jgi:hypothetical protein
MANLQLQPLLVQVNPQSSRLKDGSLETFSKVLAALDLKVVPTSYRSIDPDRMRAFCTLFEAAMTRPDNLEHLLLEGDE